jgi:hypothetical protein
MSGITDTLTNKLLGSTTTVRIKRYGDGTVSFQEVTAGKAEKRTDSADAEQGWVVALFKALATVA